MPGPTMPGHGNDPLNDLLGPTPAHLATSVIDTPKGMLALATIRTPSTTLTVFLTPADLQAWTDNLGHTLQKAKSLLTVVSGRKVPGANGHGKVNPDG